MTSLPREYHTSEEMAPLSGRSSPALQRDYLIAPITALAFFTSSNGTRYLLVGEDTDIRVYDTSSDGTLICQFSVFQIQSIHGIHVRRSSSGTSILVWGNQSLAVLPTRVIESRLSLSQNLPPPRVLETRAPDWVFDGVLTDKEGQCFLVTAHNEVLEVAWDPAQQGDSFALRFGRVIFPARPALYSARLAYNAKGEVLVAGGTVFGEIVVWKCATQRQSAPEVLFIFSGHEGSIFGVDFSEEVEMPDGSRGRLLASCSDDRTVRVWDVSEGAARGVTIDHGFYEARETGFRGVDAALSAVQDRTGAEVAVAMGHISRIWGVKFGCQLPGPDSGKLRLPLYSFGEDSTVSKWRLNLDVDGWQKRAAKRDQAQETASGDISTLTHESTLSHHNGKHIWAADLTHPARGQLTLIATGGADGRVNLITDVHSSKAPSSERRSSGDVEPLRELRSVVVKDLLTTLPVSRDTYIKRSKSRQDTFQKFSYLTNDTVLAVTNGGLLLLGTFEPDLHWKEIPLNGIDPQDLSYCSDLRSPVPGVAVLSTTTKKLFLYQNESILEIATLSGKVSDLFCLDPISLDDDRYYKTEGCSDIIELLAVLIGDQEVMQVLTLDVKSRTLTSITPIVDQEASYTATSACFLSPGVLAIGSRYGHVGLFKKSEAGITLLARLDRHTSDAITAIVALPNQNRSLIQDRFLFLTTCRDGYYRLYETLPSPSGTPSIRLLHETASLSVPTIENAWFTAPSPSGSRDFILVGFRGKTFALHNETHRRDIATLDCGGGRRAFDYRPLSPTDPSTFRFAFNRNLDLGVYMQHSAGYTVLESGAHGREIRAVAVHDRWLASGSEDTSIRIWEYTDSPQDTKRNARCVAWMKVHRAGLQAMKWVPLPQKGQAMLFSCAGNEEFIVWRVRQLEGTGGAFAGPAVLKEAEYEDKTPDKDLRIMDFDITVVDDEEANEEFSCLATMAFSNSTFKTYQYSTATGFRLLAEGRYTGACITKVQLLNNVDGTLEVLTAASDGHIAIWSGRLPPDGDVTQYSPELVTPLHQNSIKAFELRRAQISADEERYIIITGGDDNALVVTEVRRSLGVGRVAYAVISKHGIKSAHAAAINALVILSEEDTAPGNPTTFMTASNDQRIKVWRVGAGSEGDRQISLLGDRNSAVADPGDLDIISQAEGVTKIMVVGVGMEVWHFSQHQKRQDT